MVGQSQPGINREQLEAKKQCLLREIERYRWLAIGGI